MEASVKIKFSIIDGISFVKWQQIEIKTEEVYLGQSISMDG